MSPGFILSCVAAYFSFLLLIAWLTSRNATNASYFLGNKASPWLAVAFGLIGDSLSGVTFVSVPGQVGTARFSYLQMVLGYILGYVVIAQVLLPLYYRLNLTSIYSYLRQRFGPWSQKSGSAFFLVSRLAGAAVRLFVTATVLQMFVFDRWSLFGRWVFPFWATVSVTILLILIYTLKGGIKTLVWTDTFQSTFLLLGLILSVAAIARELDFNPVELVQSIAASEHSQVFFWDWRDPKFFFKQFFSGAFIAIVMTGLDQNMMQKNLSCRSLPEAQKNIYSFTVVMVFVNLLFLSLGALLYEYSRSQGIPIPQRTDHLFPMLALQYFGTFAGVAFILGLTAATFSSADSVLTTLTTAFCIDFLGMEERSGLTEQAKMRLRKQVHFGFALVLLGVILVFKALNTQAVIDAVFTLASYTYGPLLGLFAFGLFCRAAVWDRWVPAVCLVSPVLTYLAGQYAPGLLGGYRFGFELLILNGLFTFIGLGLIRTRAE